MRAQPQPVAAHHLARRFPITAALIALNLLVFLAMVLRGVHPLHPAIDQMMNWGAQYGPLTLDGDWWRLFSSMFLHYGFIHLALNMWCLWNLGLLAESLFRRWTFLVIYLASGIGADIFSLSWDPIRVSAGASGAVFGLAGALITSLYFARLAVPRSELQGIIKSVVLFAGYNLVFGFTIKTIDNMAHLGGLVTGLLIGLAMAPVLSRPKDQRTPAKLAIMSIAAIVLFAAVLAVKHVQVYAVFFFRGEQLLQNRDYSGALAELQQAASRKPNHAMVQALLGLAYEANKDKANAITAYQRALRLDPSIKFARENLQNLQQGGP
jgi:membrane associated rhomboid family serine protease